MSTQKEVDETVNILSGSDLSILHCVSTYPTPTNELNLNVIKTYQKKYPHLIIGYSGHESSVTPSLMAAVIGAEVIERHITLKRTMWGTDNAASLEMNGMKLLVEYIKRFQSSYGDGKKRLNKFEKGKLLDQKYW